MTTGIHHTTGITGDAQANVDFYADLLGLRLVKRTVSHNDPTTLHQLRQVVLDSLRWSDDESCWWRGFSSF